jgi:hypothetical protein
VYFPINGVQILGLDHIEELDTDFTKTKKKEVRKCMKNNKATGSDGMPAEAWEMFSTKHKGIDILMDF